MIKYRQMPILHHAVLSLKDVEDCSLLFEGFGIFGKQSSGDARLFVRIFRDPMTYKWGVATSAEDLNTGDKVYDFLGQPIYSSHLEAFKIAKEVVPTLFKIHFPKAEAISVFFDFGDDVRRNAVLGEKENYFS